MFHPMSLVQLLLRPSPWVDFFWFSRGVLATLAQECPKTHGKTKKKKKHPMSPVQFLLRPSPWVDFFLFAREYPKTHGNKKNKQTKNHPMSPVQLLLRPSIFCCFLENAPKPMEKQKKKSPHVTCPASPQTLSMGRNFFWGGFLEVFATLAQECPKTHGKNKKKITPCHLSSFSSDPLHGSKFVFCFLFGFFEVFCHFVSPTMSVAHFSCFLFSCFCWVPGRKFHPDKHPLAQFSLLHILYWCLH